MIKSVSGVEALLLLDLWAADKEWLRRLRRCQLEGCTTPYFIDTSPASHGRFCRVAHRVAYSRTLEGQMRKEARSRFGSRR